jgi:hypothetical protein
MPWPCRPVLRLYKAGWSPIRSGFIRPSRRRCCFLHTVQSSPLSASCCVLRASFLRLVQPTASWVCACLVLSCLHLIPCLSPVSCFVLHCPVWSSGARLPIVQLRCITALPISHPPGRQLFFFLRHLSSSALPPDITTSSQFVLPLSGLSIRVPSSPETIVVVFLGSFLFRSAAFAVSRIW